ncbi:MAG: hemerythrin domain-containing protein [Nitrospira sp.]|nr:hemerythrin domain-containing protein [Nitrospira sp.]
MPKRAMAPKKDTTMARTSDALQLLKQDHQAVLYLLDACIAAPSEGRAALAQQIFRELEIHTALEEELFYPALEREISASASGEAGHHALNGTTLFVDGDDLDGNAEGEDALDPDDVPDEEGEDIVATAYEDHRAVTHMIQRLNTMDPVGEEFQGMMAELQHMVRYHIEEEEEVIFPEARLTLDLLLLGQQMLERKQELLASR